MVQVVKSALLSVPASSVYAFLIQAERNSEWVPRVTHSERLTPGPTVVGTRFRFNLEFMGQVVGSTDEVIELVPNRLIRSHAIQGLKHSVSWQLEPVGDDGAVTLVTYSMAFQLPPILRTLTARLFNLESLFEEQAKACLYNLRQILEEGETGASPSHSGPGATDA